MTEGMLTRSKAVDDQLNKIADQLEQHHAKLDSFSSVIQQHNETFEKLQKNLTSQQTVLADMMHKLAKLDKPPPQPPLLPLPNTTPLFSQPPSSQNQTAPSSSTGQPPPLSVPNQTDTAIITVDPTTPLLKPPLPKLEIPLFSGDNSGMVVSN